MSLVTSTEPLRTQELSETERIRGAKGDVEVTGFWYEAVGDMTP